MTWAFVKDEDRVEDAETERHGAGVMAARAQWRPHIAVATPGPPRPRGAAPLTARRRGRRIA